MGILAIIVVAAGVVFIMGTRIVRPTHRGLIERFGKYNRFAAPGFHWVFPLIENLYQVNTTEQMVDAQPQEIITDDNLNESGCASVF